MGARKVNEDYGIILARVSDYDQASGPEQVEMGRGRAASMDVPIPEDGIYFDRGDSRSTFLTREALQEVLARAQDPRCKYIFVWQFTRMIGSLKQYVEIMDQLRKAKVKLYEADGTLVNPDDHASQLGSIVKAWQSEGEVMLVRKRVRDTHNIKANHGRLISRPPYGVEVVPILSLPCKGDGCNGRDCEIPHSTEVSAKNMTVWIRHQQHIENLNLIFNWAASGMTMYAIERRLVQAGITSPLATVKRGKNVGRQYGGTPFSSDNIRRMIQNRFYRGEFTWGQTRIIHEGDDNKKTDKIGEQDWIIRPHSLGPLVDPEVWDEANRQIELRLNMRDRGRKYPVRLLDGFVKCGRCGRTMSPRKRGRAPRKETTGLLFDYHCGGQYEIYSTCTENHAIPESWLLKALVGEAAQVQMTSRTPRIDVTHTVQAETDSVGPELRAIEAKLGELVTELAQIELMTIKGFYSVDKGIEKQAEKQAEQAALVERREELLMAPVGASMTTEAPAAVQAFLHLIVDERLPMDERRAELSRLLARVVVDRPSVHFVFREQAVQTELEPETRLRSA